jgi:glyceraldehyde 3-phosphate dehydrogenase
VVDAVIELERSATVEEVNKAFKAAAEGSMKGILGFSMEPLVSMDFKGDTRSSIVDGLSTMMMGSNMVKILTWYDNEWAYSTRIADLVKLMADRGL